MKKAIIPILLALIAALLLAGCAGNTPSGGEPDPAGNPAKDTAGRPETPGGTATEPPHDHAYTAETVAPTCTEKGYTRHVCPCGNEYTDSEVPAAGHTPEEIAAVGPTCTEPGHTAGSRCPVCGEYIVKPKEIPAAHHPGEMKTVKEPTCTAPGQKESVCTLCGEVLSQETIPANGHRAWDWITDLPATCVSEGKAHQVCTVCGETVAEKALPKADHTPSAWITDKKATCTAEGTEHNECTVCKVKLSTRAIPKTSHSYGAWKAVTAATCQAGGTEERICTVCGAKETRSTAAGAHVYEKGTCKWCGAIDPTIGTISNPIPANNTFTVPFRAYTYFGTSYTIEIICGGVTSGPEANSIIASENMFNTKPGPNQEWRIYLFALGCASSGDGGPLEAYELINQYNFYTAQGASLAVYDTATFGNKLGAYSPYKVTLYPGATGIAGIALLVDKSVGDVILKIPNGSGQYWLSCTPEN